MKKGSLILPFFFKKGALILPGILTMKYGTLLLPLLAILFMTFSGCEATQKEALPVRTQVKVPDWVLYYKDDRKICGIGVSKPHIKGLAYQRLLAISRGIDEIARQLGVTVETRLETYMTGTSENVRTGLSAYSVQTSEGTTVVAQIEKAWMNEETNEFHVLMCMKK